MQTKTELILIDINEKIKNKNKFIWKFTFGWLIAVPFFFLSGILASDKLATEASIMVGAILGIIGALLFLINLFIGVVALYKSTKNMNVEKAVMDSIEKEEKVEMATEKAAAKKAPAKKSTKTAAKPAAKKPAVKTTAAKAAPAKKTVAKKATAKKAK